MLTSFFWQLIISIYRFVHTVSHYQSTVLPQKSCCTWAEFLTPGLVAKQNTATSLSVWPRTRVTSCRHRDPQKMLSVPGSNSSVSAVSPEPSTIPAMVRYSAASSSPFTRMGRVFLTELLNFYIIIFQM